MSDIEYPTNPPTAPNPNDYVLKINGEEFRTIKIVKGEFFFNLPRAKVGLLNSITQTQMAQLHKGYTFTTVQVKAWDGEVNGTKLITCKIII